MRLGFLRYCVLALFAIGVPLATACAAVGPVPPTLVSDLGLTPWYRKYVDANGIAILGSSAVSDATLLRARHDVMRMTATLPDATRSLVAKRVRVVIFGRSEAAGSIPEFGAAFGQAMNARFWAGFGATAALPICAGNEANIADGVGGENVFVHEFAHTVADLGIGSVDPGFKVSLAAAYDAARARGLWRNTYAASNASEYWAEGVQSYFSVNRKGPPAGDGIHNAVSDQAKLRSYDAPLYRLVQAIFGDAPL